MKTALEKKGFSFVEMVSQCPTAYGRRTKSGDGVDMIQWFKTFPRRKKDDPIEQKIPTRDGVDLGVFADRDEISFIDSMNATYAGLED